jgi:hypothetical protein
MRDGGHVPEMSRPPSEATQGLDIPATAPSLNDVYERIMAAKVVVRAHSVQLLFGVKVFVRRRY